MKNWTLKIGLILAWPLITAFVVVLIVVAMFGCWIAIPFGTVKTEGGKWTMDFPWSS